LFEKLETGRFSLAEIIFKDHSGSSQTMLFDSARTYEFLCSLVTMASSCIVSGKVICWSKMADFYITPVFSVPVRDDPIVIFLTAFSCATDGQMDGYDTIRDDRRV